MLFRSVSQSRYERSVIANTFCYAVRNGHATVDALLTAVRQRMTERAMERDLSEEDVSVFLRVITLIEQGKATNYAKFIIHRESLSKGERGRSKHKSSAVHIRNYMKDKPPTDKQLDFLRKSGCEVIPSNRLEASDLITDYVNRKSL